MTDTQHTTQGSVKSRISVKSLRSVKSFRLNLDGEDDYGALDFDDLVVKLCTKFNCPLKPIVKKDFDEYKSMKQLYAASSRITGNRTSSVVSKAQHRTAQRASQCVSGTVSETDIKTIDPSFKPIPVLSEAADTIVITALYDDTEYKLREILFHKENLVPRELLQIIGLIASNFKYLKKISFKRCRINGYTVYEMRQFLPLTFITDVCLDDSPLQESDYGILLSKPCRITSLSLCRCMICDKDCVQIAAKLHFLEAAGSTLVALNLSSNHITDLGAKSIGEALRTNRHLRYLNLADNQIGDDGVDRILHALIDFTLTCDEIMAKRRRYWDFLKSKHSLYLKYVTEWDSKSMDNYDLSGNKHETKKWAKQNKDKLLKRDEYDFTHISAETMASEIVGEFIDPFASNYTKFKDGHTHSIGNMVLCYLNLSYNNLSYLSLKKLHSALLYQSVDKSMDQTGLLKVVINGNPMPTSCPELNNIAELLHDRMLLFGSRYKKTRKSCCSRKSFTSKKLEMYK